MSATAKDRRISLEKEARAQGVINLLKNDIVKSDAQQLGYLKVTNKLEKEVLAAKLETAEANKKDAEAKFEVGHATEKEVQDANNAYMLAKQNLELADERADKEEALLILSKQRRDVESKIGVLQQELKAISDSFIATGADRLTKIKDELKFQDLIRAAELEKLRIRAAELSVSKDIKEERRAELNLILAQIDAAERLDANADERARLAEIRAEFELQKDILDAKKSVIDKELELVSIQQEISRNSFEYLSLQRKQFNLKLDD